ncbi:cupin domain-containing protein [Nitratireductor aquimarinus]|uniref:ChrR family anti-sigma-E factor n=1 Tax=Alphaproteobacteria TaxID=28211 RepID=UPI0019D408BD|nr:MULTISPECIES: ChrR family anti-sigma-E factor [Alphaproteobacteria]MBY6021143.1 ChrR family anti-sigma-E factor [Nitratireductor sp. DP7N14-4]MBN7756357.1 cupin domain-containing protein [Nitratireductor aquimarinus]MBN8245547.1 cupin domain-containing protein [Nitratireductor aquimarinus]MBY5999116.1 ChrR family anti-sigma-E factor [Tritonibacter mobilis]MBY6133929.1 ChrR family anti-sigma-E factor [Nitratireductor aquimarinus]
MSIQHHISEELLLDYATGQLSEGWRIAVATHLALCPSCRRRLAVMEMTGGALIAEPVDEEATQEAASDESASWESLRKRLAADRAHTPDAERPVKAKASSQAGQTVLPEPLRSYVGGDVDTVKWRPLGRGAYHLPIETDDGTARVRLLRIPAGKPVPEHGHRGRELTLVLSGSFHDGDDLFARGDFEEADETLQHQPIATEGEDCICLAVTDAPLKFRSWLVRAVQPIIGI